MRSTLKALIVKMEVILKLLKIGILTVVVMMMVSCSNEQLSLEERLVDELNSSDIYYDEIIHYELKDDFVFVFYTVANNLFDVYLDLTSSNLEIIGGGGSLDEQGILITETDNLPYYFSYLISNNPEVERVEVYGKPAKNINSKGVSFWIIFSEQPMEEEDYTAYDHQGNQVELIKKD